MSNLRCLALAATLLALPSCSLVVASQDPIPCERATSDPCPDEMNCVRRVCVPVECDADGDNFGCDGTSDCDDTNPNVNPTAMEVCDGRDNNCDELIDDNVCMAGFGCGQRGGQYQCLDLEDCYLGLSECADTERCDPDSGRCGPPPSTDCNVQACTGTTRCNELTGICVEPLPLGESCVRGFECITNHCFPRASLGEATSGSICSAPCSSNADCTGTARGVCLATGTGARGCVPMPPTSPAPACTRHTDCGMETCRLDASDTFVCGPPPGSSINREECIVDSDCVSGACLGGFDTYCAAPCGASSDCLAGEICRYRNTGSFLEQVWVTTCAEAEAGVGMQGATCGANNQCRERYCAAGEARYCANVCTRDSECGAAYACRPVDNSGWELRCLRR